MAASPYDEEEPVPHDPIGIVSHWIGGGYLNLAINYYKGKDSQFEHTFLLRSSLDEATSVLHLYLFHDGNGENPPQKETSDLVVESGIFSLSLGDEPLSGLVFTYDSILLQDGEYTILPQSVSSY